MTAMADVARQTITINATPEHCLAVVTDFEHYPEWAKDVKEAIVRARDESGRATEVEFRASALGRTTTTPTRPTG
jgi:ribosome-associated toxin RatA of RatAB toxin-antitoxin module